MKRDLHGHAGAPHFLTHNLQSWIDSEHYAATSEAARNFAHRRPTRDSHHHNRHSHDHNHHDHHHHHQPRYHRDLSLDDMDIAEEELDNVGTTYRDSGASASTVDELHNSRIVPSFVLNRYHPLSEVYKFLDDVESRTPGVTVFTIGHTHENRPIKAIEVLNRPADPRFVWIDACTHAREWVTVTTSLYVLEQTILQKIPLNFIIVPVLNVDGYVYTWTKDRMWRKNRRPYEASRLSAHAMPDRCTGVDLNRNYDINFGGEGSSGNACSYLYQGPFPFSEPEVKAAAELLAKNRHRIKMTLSLHSFNQLWASPNAFTTARTADHAHHMRVLNAVGKAVQATNGVKYDVGPLGASLYLGSGFMMDWIYHKLGIRDAYLVELRDKGFHGFILPAEQIWPTATETWAGLRAAMKAIFGV